MSLSRRSFATLTGAALAGGFIGAPALLRAQTLKKYLVTAPQSVFSHLPLHCAIQKGFFAAEGLDIHVLAMDSGSGHTNAVLSGQAIAFIGGPEHNAFAEIKGAKLRAIVNMVDRNNNYLSARKGLTFALKDLPSMLRGKTIATGYYGGTPNSTTRYICVTAGLKIGEDVKLLEGTASAALAAVQTGRADFAMMSDPILTKGIKAGIWEEPVWQGPSIFGSYAYTVLNVADDTIKKDPQTVAGFVRAVRKGLGFVYANQQEATEIARKAFPTMDADDVKTTLQRSFADKLWSQDGMITETSWQNAEKVVIAAGLLKQEVPYTDVIDMEFMKA